jgi:DNA-binding transcriptional regulator YdaS (Cro superfamily)
MAVYAIRGGQKGPIKLGSADAPAERLAALQTAHYEKLLLIRTWAGGFSEEKWLHHLFRSYRLVGEWFDISEADLPDSLDRLPVKPKKERLKKPAGEKTPLDLAISAVGSSAALARKLGIKKTAISQWRGRPIPVQRAQEISRITGISLPELRPDVWTALDGSA